MRILEKLIWLPEQLSGSTRPRVLASFSLTMAATTCSCTSAPSSVPAWARSMRARSFHSNRSSTACAARPARKTFAPCDRLLRLVVRGDADRLVIVGRIEFCTIAAPGLVLQYAVDLAEPGRRKPQRDHLSDPHHHIPADHLDAGRGKGFVKTLLLELRVEFA